MHHGAVTTDIPAAWNDESHGPPAAGVRQAWADVPPHLRAEVESRLGVPVARAENISGGFSPGVAARLRLADGCSAFVKAAGPEPNPDTPHIHRRERLIARALPPNVPAPRLLDAIDEDGWIVLLFEHVAGVMPAQPWRTDELDRVLRAFTELAELLTPSPVDLTDVPDLGGGPVSGWAGVLERHERGEDELDGLPGWVRERLGDLARIEQGALDATAGDSLIHCDLRADNLLLTPDRVVAVDWPWARLRAPWFDLLAFLPSVRLQGGPPPREIFATHPVSAGADPDAVTTALTGLAGFFIGNGRLPAPPGLPTVRAFQTAQGRIALEWLRERIGPR